MEQKVTFKHTDDDFFLIDGVKCNFFGSGYYFGHLCYTYTRVADGGMVAVEPTGKEGIANLIYWEE